MSTQEKAKHTPGPWKVELDGTMSGNWLVIYVDDPSYDGGKRELFRSETLQTNANVRRNTLKQRWIDQPNAEEIRANAHLCAASWEMLNALKAVKSLFASTSPFYIQKLDAPITNGDQERIDRVFIALDAAIAKAEADTGRQNETRN